jgi:hypothetical protein
MLPGLTRARRAAKNASPALKFVVMVGIMSFFADFTYEGSRSITGPYLGLLGAGAFAISVISGAGDGRQRALRRGKPDLCSYRGTAEGLAVNRGRRQRSLPSAGRRPHAHARP